MSRRDEQPQTGPGGGHVNTTHKGRGFREGQSVLFVEADGTIRIGSFVRHEHKGRTVIISLGLRRVARFASEVIASPISPNGPSLLDLLEETCVRR